VDADALLTNGVFRGRQSRVVLHPDAGVKSVDQSAGDGGKKAGHRGERGISRKPLRGDAGRFPVNSL